MIPEVFLVTPCEKVPIHRSTHFQLDGKDNFLKFSEQVPKQNKVHIMLHICGNMVILYGKSLP